MNLRTGNTLVVKLMKSMSFAWVQEAIIDVAKKELGSGVKVCLELKVQCNQRKYRHCCSWLHRRFEESELWMVKTSSARQRSVLVEKLIESLIHGEMEGLTTS